jgi:BirA family biotin operon repressor/biotin-[acetyl-CoA-carboxylase] ligase
MELRLLRHGVVDSTNECAFTSAETGEGRHGDLHVAEGQSAGRGRRGSRWESTPGEGVYASLLLLPSPEELRPTVLTMAAGLGVLETVRELGATDARLKWPNDVIAREAKLAGILVETRGLPGPEPVVVVGIGINVRQRAFSAELEDERPVTSLLRQGIDAGVNEVLGALCRRLPRRVQQAFSAESEILADYLPATTLADRLVRARRGEEILRGRLEELSLDRGLVLRRTDGAILSLALEHVTALELDPGE